MFSGIVYIYLFVFSSAQTQSGAGHISMALGTDTSHLTYYTKYRKIDGGCFKEKDLSLYDAMNYDRIKLKHQAFNPVLVLRLRADSIEQNQLEAIADQFNLNKPWSLFANNCADAVKKVLRETKVNPGLALMISTPSELIKDLCYHQKKEIQTKNIQILHGNLKQYLDQEPKAVPQTLFGKHGPHAQFPPYKEALLILPGFGSKYHSLHRLKNTFKKAPYDVFVPRYIARASLEETLENLELYWQRHGLDAYQKVHVFGYIVGSWTINAWIAQHGKANIATIVYDRSTLQERAPLVLVQDMKFVNFVLFGDVMQDLLQTPYTPLLDSTIRKGMLLETYATNTVRKHQQTAASMGPYCWELSCFGQDVDDYRYVPMHHDQMYTHPEVFAAALLYFIENGNFGPHLQSVQPVENPFVKHKP